MGRLVEAAIDRAVTRVRIGLDPKHLICASFEPGDIRVENLPPQCARAEQAQRDEPYNVLGLYRSGDAERLRRDLEARAKKEARKTT